MAKNNSLKRAAYLLTNSKSKNRGTPRGNAGYDNSRENIDPHIKTKTISQLQGTIEHTPTNAKDVTNKEYVDSAITAIPLTDYAKLDATNQPFKGEIISEGQGSDIATVGGISLTHDDLGSNKWHWWLGTPGNYEGYLKLGYNPTNQNDFSFAFASDGSPVFQTSIAVGQNQSYGERSVGALAHYMPNYGAKSHIYFTNKTAGVNAEFKIACYDYYGGLHLRDMITLNSGTADNPTIIFDGGNVGINTTSPDTHFQVVGGCKLGDDNTNYASFATDGELTLTGTARVIKCVTIRVGGFKAPGSNPAELVDLGIAQAFAFDKTTQEYICTEITLPPDMDRSVAPYLIADWSSEETTGSARWNAEYLYRAEDEDMTAAAQDTLEGTADPSTTANGLVRTTLTGFAVPSATDRCMLVRISRDPSHADDDMNGDAHVTAIKFCYTSNKLGEAL